ncbi:endonuclease/exonuclease/phosphatase family protein [Spirochaeta isovalerica]|uniref:Endonuclease/exonuclease/phosphatase family metal-dependent hydrolase n=1 Tax=Spirochaeta isovalerica TaxID=150 RepID=A0A841RCS5_9SPIO|nr:endonuclease/exonuclease/phosphatase family protein [Spirochaeta isovalerica]MBB6481466.1 endonuclease/exonuclease/phosphatase family metal-dependent hydrolase [Spirochaeta isovalerica]
MKKILLIIVYTIVSLVIILGGLVLWLTITDYRPDLITSAEMTNQGQSPRTSESLTIINWNLGYGGLGENMDFFMDGGTGVRAPEAEYLTNWQGIETFIRKNTADVYFFQEMDRKSTRSYKNDQYEITAELLAGYNRTFAPNYKVKYIPSPTIVGTQYGSVLSGLALFSRFPFSQSLRYSLPGNYKWPKSVFFLDRCLLVSTATVSGGKEVVFINAHLSAYDKGGFLKKDQLKFLKDLAEKEYGDGKYVIIGGDWNSYMPGTDGATFKSEEKAPDFYQPLPPDWQMEGWTWGADRSTPTNRSLAAPYKAGETFTTVIDGFLLSPNLELKSINTIDLNFKHTDHNPLRLEVSFR